MDYCTLATMSNLGNAAAACQPAFSTTAQQSFSGIAKQFFPQNSTELALALLRNSGVITGSAALRMLMGSIYEEPRDLNIVVARGKMIGFEDWLLLVGYEETGDLDIYLPLASEIHEFRVYRDVSTHSNIVTISETSSHDIMRLIVRSPSTADMTFMTGGGIVSLYPTMTLRSESLINSGMLTDDRDYTAEGRFGSINTNREKLVFDTAFMEDACGSICPFVWRYVRTDSNILVQDWDHRYSVKGIITSSQTEWRLSTQCANYHCPHYKYNRAIGGTFQLDQMPATVQDVGDRSIDIDQHFPALAKGFKAMLYTTYYAEPFIVNVPLNEGTATYQSVEDLYVECWVAQRSPADTIANRENLRKMFRAIPGTDTNTNFAYTVLVESESANAPFNPFVTSLTSSARWSKYEYFQGNILILKHTNNEELAPRDMCDKDEYTVDLLIRW
ncbi:hypothetical protein BJ138DRAFT_1105677 [Hygrophoropsis aurantiaca]|uniref:Uncharacterized protein n=1 Tax=Hygrophoropsis aurantiaca TaxID=72124 RepID=A0ACB7ZXG8_9AGAM|nr:hypothetical protein BJ138DRAFT_1105677 [Hygrophoropsis aurantiaca]